MSNKPIEIAICFDSNLYVAACALIVSVAKTRQSERAIIVHVFTDQKYTPDLSFATALPIELRLHRIDASQFEDPYLESLSVASCFRLLLADLLPACEKIIYLDTDIIVLRELDALFDMPMEGHAIAASRDYTFINQCQSFGVFHGDYFVDPSFYASHFAGTKPERYFNSGVMLLDLQRWRSDDITQRSFDWIKKRPTASFPDQDALNAVLPDFLEIDCRWNAFVNEKVHGPSTDDPADVTWRQIIEQWQSDAWIAHFAGPTKPWTGSVNTRFDRLFWEYASAAGVSRIQAHASTGSKPPQGAPSLPLVSVVIINYNYGRFLRQCVESVVYQNYPRIECIVIDNASADDSGRVLDELQERFGDKLLVHRGAENLGQGGASKLGFDLSHGAFVLFLDADDYLLKDALKTHIFAHLSAPHAAGFTSGDMLQIGGNSIVVGRYLDLDSKFGFLGTSCNKRLICREKLKDIRGYGRASAKLFVDMDRDKVKLYEVNERNIDWVWAPTSGNLFRREPVAMFIAAKGADDLRINFDAFLNHAVNAFAGSILIDRPVACYRLHDSNSFAKGAPVKNFINYERGSDLGSFCAYLALRHVENNYDFFERHTKDLNCLRVAIDALKRKANNHPRRWEFLRNLYSNVIHAGLKIRLRSLRKIHAPRPAGLPRK